MAAPVQCGGGYQNAPWVASKAAMRDTPALASAAINTDFATMTRPEWRISDGLVPYDEALATMEARVADIRAGRAGELIWLLEHPPLYTAGTSATASDLLAPNRFPVYEAGRGGQYTYHGPGQRVAYVMLDLRQRGHFVAHLPRVERFCADANSLRARLQRQPGGLARVSDQHAEDTRPYQVQLLEVACRAVIGSLVGVAAHAVRDVAEAHGRGSSLGGLTARIIRAWRSRRNDARPGGARCGTLFQQLAI